jgi:hypothetical protein
MSHTCRVTARGEEDQPGQLAAFGLRFPGTCIACRFFPFTCEPGCIALKTASPCTGASSSTGSSQQDGAETIRGVRNTAAPER